MDDMEAFESDEFAFTIQVKMLLNLKLMQVLDFEAKSYLWANWLG